MLVYSCGKGYNQISRLKGDLVNVTLCYNAKIGRGVLNILFWNTYKLKNRDNINNSLLELALEKECDIIILAEYEDAISQLCKIINTLSKDEYIPIPSYGGCQKIKGLIKKKYKIENIREQTRYQIIIIKTTFYDLMIAMIHNISKLSASERVQEENLRNFHYDICIEENKHSIKSTLVIGDFNANPFEPSCIAANAMHAIPFVEELQRSSRIVQEREYEKFYSPMWKFWNKREAPYSTYYYNNSDMINYFWNAYDQVIMRPQLIDAFEYDSLIIVTETTSHQLLKGKRPDKDNYSDHLPLYCILKEENIR